MKESLETLLLLTKQRQASKEVVTDFFGILTNKE